MQNSRENIKTRMLKNAARAWGLPETEAESNFDPLVSMLLTACSIELEKISGEIESSRARVLERMVQLLSPDAFTGAFPAHAVATATPIEKKSHLAESTQFYISRKFQAASESDDPVWKDIFFTPTAAFTLSKATIRFMASGRELYKISNSITKELVGHCETDKELPSCSLWLGIDEPTVTLQDCSFYFDLRNEANRQLFYHQLPKATWYWDDRPITHEPGFGRSISGEKLDLKNILQKEDDVSGKIKRHVNAFYKSFFVTLTDLNSITTSEGNAILSDMISDAFTGNANEFKPLRDSLLHHGDPFLVMADYDSYSAAQAKVGWAYQNQPEWTRKAILNTARVGKFSSDRTILEYAEKVWKLPQVAVP